jgi:hypothetical protein
MNIIVFVCFVRVFARFKMRESVFVILIIERLFRHKYHPLLRFSLLD